MGRHPQRGRRAGPGGRGVGAVLDPPGFRGHDDGAAGCLYRAASPRYPAVTTGVTMRRSAPRRYLPRLPRRTLTRSLMLIRRRRRRRRGSAVATAPPAPDLTTRRRLRRLRRGRTRRPGSGAPRRPRPWRRRASALPEFRARVAAVAARAGHVARGEPGARPAGRCAARSAGGAVRAGAAVVDAAAPRTRRPSPRWRSRPVRRCRWRWCRLLLRCRHRRRTSRRPPPWTAPTDTYAQPPAPPRCRRCCPRWPARRRAAEFGARIKW